MKVYIVNYLSLSMDPLLKPFSLITKFYAGMLGKMLKNLPLKRYHYMLLVIGDRQISLKDLAANLHVDKVTITRAVHYLEEKNVVIKRTNQNDRRSYIISLTGKGEIYLKEIKIAFHEIDRLCMEGVDAKIKDNFFNALAYIMDKLESSPVKKLRYN
jgi:DNA-binding MarR family transcriptional regulator